MGVNPQLLAGCLAEVLPLLGGWRTKKTTVSPGTDIGVLFPPAQFGGKLHL